MEEIRKNLENINSQWHNIPSPVSDAILGLKNAVVFLLSNTDNTKHAFSDIEAKLSSRFYSLQDLISDSKQELKILSESLKNTGTSAKLKMQELKHELEGRFSDGLDLQKINFDVSISSVKKSIENLVKVLDNVPRNQEAENMIKTAVLNSSQEVLKEFKENILKQEIKTLNSKIVAVDL